MPQSSKMASIIDSIPSSVDIKNELDLYVNGPIEETAARLALWAVQAYREAVKATQTETHGISLKCPGRFSFEVHAKAAWILRRKGWHYSDNFVTNKIYMLPCEPNAFDGLKPCY